MDYAINVRYITGDSFGSEETETLLSPVWDNQEDAYKALFELHEFNEYYMAFNNERWTPSKQEKVLERARKREWAVPYNSNVNKVLDWDFDDGMMIYHKSGRIRICTNFITGYFETLVSAEVIIDMKKIGDWSSNIDLERLEKKYGSH